MINDMGEKKQTKKKNMLGTCLPLVIHLFFYAHEKPIVCERKIKNKKTEKCIRRYRIGWNGKYGRKIK